MIEEVFISEEEAARFLERPDMQPYRADIERMKKEGYSAKEIADFYWCWDE